MKYIGREAHKEQEAYPLFMGFASQVGLVPRFAPQAGPIRLRAEEFKQAKCWPPSRSISTRCSILPPGPTAGRWPNSEKTELLELVSNALRKKNVSHEDALRGVLARMLVSPDFLYHLGSSAAGDQAAAGQRLGARHPAQLFPLVVGARRRAARRPPPRADLHDPKVLAEQTRRMLEDDRVRALAIEFGTQWIHVRGFDEFKEKNEKLFPTFDAQLRSAIYEESILFFQDLFQSDRPVTRILDADYTFLNETLAKHYGIPGVAGPQWRRVEGVQEIRPRRHSGAGERAGEAVRRIADQPGAARQLGRAKRCWAKSCRARRRMCRSCREEEGGHDGLTVRQLVEKHASVAAVRRLPSADRPVRVFALEHYDAIGRFARRISAALAIDSKAKLKDGTEFDGIDGLRNYLLTKKKDVVVRLFCRRLLGML